jgi:GAF domain-containing protein
MPERSADRLSSTLSSLSSTLLTDDANLQDGLRRVALAGCALLDKCSSASISLIERRRPNTVAATDDVALALDDAQYDVGDGPCLTAAAARHTIRIDAVAVDRRWPTFNQAAIDHGISCSLSVPLRLTDGDLSGGLNIYGVHAAGFSESDEQVAEVFAAHASIVVANARAYWAAFELTRHLTAAMETRAVIEQAKGILMTTHGVDAEAAFDLLRRRSQTENRKLHAIAAEMAAGAGAGRG